MLREARDALADTPGWELIHENTLPSNSVGVFTEVSNWQHRL